MNLTGESNLSIIGVTFASIRFCHSERSEES
jgi:hypothetical protein